MRDRRDRPEMSDFDSAGVRIRYIDRGQGEAVVLVHSYGGDLEDQWIKTKVVQSLERHYRAIAFDARGHGGSGKPHDARSYGAEMSWDIVRLTDHLGIARAHIAGYSMGAHVVAKLLALAPQRFISAILGGAAGRRKWTADDDARAEREAKEMEQGLLISQLTRLWPPGQSRPNAGELQARSDQFLAGKDRQALAAIRRSSKDQVVTESEMRAVRIPVLGLVGSADPYRAHFDELRRLMPTLTVRVLRGATHLSAPTHPEFTPALKSFVRQHPAPTLIT